SPPAAAARRIGEYNPRSATSAAEGRFSANGWVSRCIARVSSEASDITGLCGRSRRRAERGDPHEGPELRSVCGGFWPPTTPQRGLAADARAYDANARAQ